MKPRILILDDEKLIRWSLNQIFLQVGYEVDAAATVEEAARLIHSGRYALILADLEVCGDQAKACFSEFARVQAGAGSDGAPAFFRVIGTGLPEESRPRRP